MQKWIWLLIAGAILGQSCTRHRSLPKGVTWNAESATFVWWGGQVNLPNGFTYQVDQGADTFEGHFTSADGKLVIRHDIGGYAGAWASRDKSFFFREDMIDGARVWIAKRNWPDGKIQPTPERNQSGRIWASSSSVFCPQRETESSRPPAREN
jgi:hypothetical protein